VLGCAVGQIAKSLIFKSASGVPVLVIASGAYRVDEAKVATLAGEAIGKADAAFVRYRDRLRDRRHSSARARHQCANVHRPESPRVRNCLRGRRHAARDVPHRACGPRAVAQGTVADTSP
jgi:hypothetical protein